MHIAEFKINPHQGCVARSTLSNNSIRVGIIKPTLIGPRRVLAFRQTIVTLQVFHDKLIASHAEFQRIVDLPTSDIRIPTKALFLVLMFHTKSSRVCYNGEHTHVLHTWSWSLAFAILLPPASLRLIRDLNLSHFSFLLKDVLQI